MFTGWALIAGVGGQRAVGYLARTLRQDGDPGSVERTILALHAAGANPAELAGEDLVARLERDIGRDGSVEQLCNLTAFAILALRAAGRPVPARSLAWLARQQDDDGGFNYATRGGGSDVDDTGAVLAALAGSGHAAVMQRGVRFLRAAQNRDGGFPSQPGGSSNAQSTALAVQGLLAAGVAPARVWRLRGRSPLKYLKTLIQPDGSVDYAHADAQTPVWVTAQALLALTGARL